MGRSGSGDPMNVDSYRFLPRSFRPYYEGRGPFPGEEEQVWALFPTRLSEARIGLLTSAGLYVRGSQPGFDVERERANPEWGDPGWRLIPAGVEPADIAVAHLHISDEDLLADPEIALPARLLDQLVDERVGGGATAEQMAVMGCQGPSRYGARGETGG